VPSETRAPAKTKTPWKLRFHGVGLQHVQVGHNLFLFRPRFRDQDSIPIHTDETLHICGAACIFFPQLFDDIQADFSAHRGADENSLRLQPFDFGRRESPGRAGDVNDSLVHVGSWILKTQARGLGRGAREDIYAQYLERLYHVKILLCQPRDDGRLQPRPGRYVSAVVTSTTVNDSRTRTGDDGIFRVMA